MKKMFILCLVAMIVASEVDACGSGSGGGSGGSGRIGFFARLRANRQARRSNRVSATNYSSAVATTSYSSTTIRSIGPVLQSSCPAQIAPAPTKISPIEVVVPIVNNQNQNQDRAIEVLASNVAEQTATNSLIQVTLNETNATDNLVASINVTAAEATLVAMLK